MRATPARAVARSSTLAMGLALAACGNSSSSGATTTTTGGGGAASASSATSGATGGAASTGTDGTGGFGMGWGSGKWTVEGVETCATSQPMEINCSDGLPDSSGGYEILGSTICDSNTSSTVIVFFAAAQKKTPKAGTYPVYAVKNADDYHNTPLGQVAIRVDYWLNFVNHTVWAQSGLVTVKPKSGGSEFVFTAVDATQLDMFGSSITLDGDLACPPFP